MVLIMFIQVFRLVYITSTLTSDEDARILLENFSTVWDVYDVERAGVAVS